MYFLTFMKNPKNGTAFAMCRKGCVTRCSKKRKKSPRSGLWKESAKCRKKLPIFGTGLTVIRQKRMYSAATQVRRQIIPNIPCRMQMIYNRKQTVPFLRLGEYIFPRAKLPPSGESERNEKTFRSDFGCRVTARGRRTHPKSVGALPVPLCKVRQVFPWTANPQKRRENNKALCMKQKHDSNECCMWNEAAGYLRESVPGTGCTRTATCALLVFQVGANRFFGECRWDNRKERHFCMFMMWQNHTEFCQKKTTHTYTRSPLLNYTLFFFVIR